jgi:hypothetical protein
VKIYVLATELGLVEFVGLFFILIVLKNGQESHPMALELLKHGVVQVVRIFLTLFRKNTNAFVVSYYLIEM